MKSKHVAEKDPDVVVTSMRMSVREHEALRALAQREHRTMSGQLRYIIERLVKEDPAVSESEAVA